MDAEHDIGLTKNRKRGSKKFNVMEETPFTKPYKSTIKPQDVNLEKRKTPNCLRNTRCYFCEFCDNTSIHGFKFLGERRRYFVEKVWWFLVVLGAICGSALLISKTYNKWVDSPVMVNFATTETPIWKIPFPAVTICPEMKINKTFLNYTDVYLKRYHGKDITEEEESYFQMFSLVCDNYENRENNETETLDEEAWSNFHNGFSEMEFETCKWLADEQICEEILSYTLTNAGWCRTFNMLHFEDVYNEVDEQLENRTVKNTKTKMWSLDAGYPPDASLYDAFPRRTVLAGLKAGFEVDIVVNEDDLDYMCTELQGFKVTLHHPAEEPDMDKHFRLPLNQAVVVGIRPRMISTSQEIKDYSPETRQCFLPNEKILSTFKIYTQQNCMTECFTNYTLKFCGCIGFYTSYNGAGEIRRCGPDDRLCMELVKANFFAIDVIEKMNKSGGDDIIPQCNCLPSCTSLEFDSETSQTDWQWRKTIKYLLTPSEFNSSSFAKEHRSRLIVYYKEMQFMTSERHELYGTVDFLASCGGLLGLFCGFSFTSSIEILYFLTLRFACNLKKFGRRVWSGAPEVIEDEEHEKERSEFI